jgi:AraC-like DNA-binding protein
MMNDSETGLAARDATGEPALDTLREPAPAAPTQATWSQRVSGLSTIPALLAHLGADTGAILAAAGLAPDALDDADGRIPFAAAVRVVNESVRQTRRADFGLQVGTAWHLVHMGLLGELVRQGPTFGDGIRSLVVSQRLYSQGAAPYLFEYATTAQLGAVVFHPEPDELAAIHDMIVAALVTGVRDLCGEAWRPTSVELPRASPADVRSYEAHFRCPVAFDAERAAVTFPSRDLQRRIAGADPARREVLELEISRRFDQNLLPLVYRSLRLLLLDGDATMPRLAQAFDMHERTLDRRLRLQGTSFKAILDDVRYEVARHLLRDTTRAASEIAPALGYGDDTAFARAFRRWSGMAPGQWREANAA